MIKKTLLALLFLSIFDIGNVSAQQAKVDSLENVLRLHTKEDTVKVNLLNEIAYAVYPFDITQMRSYATQGVDLSEKLNFQKGKAESLRYIGISYTRSSYEIALDYFQRAIIVAEDIDFKSSIIKSLDATGTIYGIIGKSEKAIECTEKALKMAEKINDKTAIARCIASIAKYMGHLGRYDQAIEGYKKALAQSTELNDRVLEASITHNIGVLYTNQGNYPLALEYFQNGFKIYEELGDKEGCFLGIFGIGNIYYSQSDYTKALEYAQKALKVVEELNNKMRISAALRLIGNIYKETKDPQALVYYQRALTISDELKSIPHSISTLNSIGEFYYQSGDYEKAMECFQDALEKSERIKLRSGIIISLNGLSSINFYQKNYGKALNYTLRSLELSKSMKSLTIKREIHNHLSQIYAATHDYKNAYTNHKRFRELNDSVHNESNVRKIAELEYTYKFEKEKQAIELEQQKKGIIQAAQKRQQQIVMLSFIGAFILMSLLAFFIYRSYLVKKRSNTLLTKQKEEIEAKNDDLVQLNEEISAQGEEISSQRDEIEAQRDMVVIQKDRIQAQNKLITDSINYAKHIQQALLPSSEYVEANLHEHFILFKPKDIVSGDFYWSTRVNEYLIVTVADCTGHGIPGAFMSMLGISFLNEIVAKKGVVKASDILDQLRNSVIDALKQKWQTGEQKDGMDLALIVINTNTAHLQFAGAHNPLFIVTAGKELKQLKPDSQTVAINNKMRPFTNNEIQLNKGDSIYLASDGYQDQFGGPQNSKFKRTQLKELLVAIADKPMVEQGKLLENTFVRWKGEYEQIDDVTIVGMKF